MGWMNRKVTITSLTRGSTFWRGGGVVIERPRLRTISSQRGHHDEDLECDIMT
jgi:hypothetical protein